MQLYSDELLIVQDFQLVPRDRIVPIANDETVIDDLLEKIAELGNGNAWINSSGKGDPPPDFYSDVHGLMLEIMRVDDHGYISAKNKVVNPTYELENRILNSIRRENPEIVESDVQLYIVASTDLPTKEDHNYIYYLNNFRNIVKKHLKKVSEYQKNHLGHKIIFFVQDESTMYFLPESEGAAVEVGAMFKGNLHWWFRDKEFLEVFQNANIDYLIWHTPYKRAEIFSENGLPFRIPEVVVFDIANFAISSISYDEKRMESLEI